MTGPGVLPRHPESSLDGRSGAGGSDAMGNAVSEELGRPRAAGFRLQLGASTDDGCPRPTAFGESGTDDRCRAWRLPATARSVPTLRRRLNDLLDGADLSGDERYDLLLAVCEAASNAIEHAVDPREPFIDVLSEISDDRVTIVIRDHGQWNDAASGPHRGRGLAMMWLLATTSVAASPVGTTVTIRSSPRHRSPVARDDEHGAANGRH
jgi:anti-sigma regulatory factor (Ser/Thr protein kinase)